MHVAETQSLDVNHQQESVTDRNKQQAMKKILLLVVVLGAFLAYPIMYRLSAETITIHVDKTERIQDGDTQKYMVYATNETFENTDSWIFFKRNSSDVYGLIKVEQQYEVKVAGWRWPLISSYRNIIEVK